MLVYMIMIYRKDIIVRGGTGGDGCVSFRREKYIPLGGPDGGDGGGGGSVILVASTELADLGSLTRHKEFVAGHGERGHGWRKRGKKGKDLRILVPVGTTVVTDTGTDRETALADLSTPGQELLVASGGQGGLGNSRFATPVNQAPETATPGQPGEERCIVLELKMVTDICIVGPPNAGRSTLLARVSRARPEVADYPITTREPILGVIRGKRNDLVIAELPAIVAGAHLGRGLGNSFLRHAERTWLLIFLLDGSSPTLVDDLRQLEYELGLYQSDLTHKPRIVAVNKVDLPEVEALIPQIKEELNELEAPVFYISAVSGRGVLELVTMATGMVEQASEADEAEPRNHMAIFRPKPRR